MSKVRLAVVGVGNCASSLVQGVHYYKDARPGDRVRERDAIEHHAPIGGHLQACIDAEPIPLRRRRHGQQAQEQRTRQEPPGSPHVESLPSSTSSRFTASGVAWKWHTVHSRDT